MRIIDLPAQSGQHFMDGSSAMLAPCPWSLVARPRPASQPADQPASPGQPAGLPAAWSACSAW
eukprot:3681029-Heterocapsa_arctica.AAC.1